MRGHLARVYVLPEGRVEVIPNWSDPDEIAPLDRETRFRAAHALTGTIVLYAGNFGKYQNFDNILDAAKRLRTSCPDVQFVFVGDGARREYLADRMEREALENCRILPFVPAADFPDLLASADVSLVTLEPGAEGLGVPSKFYNILASGRPTVAIVGEDSEVARVLEEADCGVRVDQGAPEQLAAVLERLHAHPEERARLGRNAREALLGRFTLRHVAEQYHRLFAEVAGRRSAAEAVRAGDAPCRT
jgi:glycosyltransferase involved in cell wall biosynthesis